jgi:hypothetical protein
LPGQYYEVLTPVDTMTHKKFPMVWKILNLF